MRYRIQFSLDGQDRRYVLKPGENLVGTQDNSDIAVAHPTISRNHAVFVVGKDRVQLADLDSANGTFVNGERLHAVTNVSTDDALLLGSVPVQLDAVTNDDAQPAAVVPPTRSQAGSPRPAESEEARQAPTTASTHPIHLLSLQVLPQLTEALSSGCPLNETAHSLGKALHQLFPTDRVSIHKRSGPPLFEAARDVEGEETTRERITVDTRDLVLEVSSQRPASLQMARPLLSSALELIQHTIDLDERGMETTESHREPSTGQSSPNLSSLDPVMSKLLDQATKIATGDVSVLILGESGTGKEVFANYLHEHSGRRPLITLNCAALPRDLLEAELFGIESGVATGVDARQGKFEQAHGGTLFLDEIGDMEPAVQAKVLRVLETGEVTRIGGSSNRPARARLISATNQDLGAMVEQGDFRLDLYHRISDWELTLPPLRDRPADLPNLISLFLQQEASARGIQVAGISKQVLAVFQNYSWPGNVRELQREIKRAVLLLSDGDLLDEQSLSQRVRPKELEPTRLEDRLNQAERRELERALVANSGQAAAAAEALDVPLSSFYRKLKAHGLKNS